MSDIPVERQNLTDAPRPVAPGWLWLALLAGPIVWSLRFLAIYVLNEAACSVGMPGLGGLGAANLSGVALVTLGISLVALLLVALATWMAYKSWRQAGARLDTDTGEEPLVRSRYMALSGVILGGLFLFVMVVETLPAFFLPPCV